MKKSKRKSKVSSNIQKNLARLISTLQKNLTQIRKNARPFLALKYWPIYLISFGLGFSLWGPLHGWQIIKNWQIKQFRQQDKLPTAETLQRQLNQLKKELKSAQNKKNFPEFNPDNFSRPALGKVIRGFKWIQSENSWRLHTGIDIGIPPGSNVLAAAAGTVSKVQELSTGAYSVTVTHGGGWKTSYSNIAKVMVIEGQTIIKGVIIGTSNTTGCDSPEPGFHFAIYHHQQPIDPEKMISGL